MIIDNLYDYFDKNAYISDLQSIINSRCSEDVEIGPYAAQAIIALLMLSKPKKPNKQESPCSCWVMNICPTCHDSLEWDPYELFEPKHCPECGQAIDWNDDND